MTAHPNDAQIATSLLALSVVLDTGEGPDQGIREWDIRSEPDWRILLSIRTRIRDLAEQRASEYLAALGLQVHITYCTSLHIDDHGSGLLGFPEYRWPLPPGAVKVACFIAASRVQYSGCPAETTTYDIPLTMLWNPEGTKRRAQAARDREDARLATVEAAVERQRKHDSDVAERAELRRLAKLYPDVARKAIPNSDAPG